MLQVIDAVVEESPTDDIPALDQEDIDDASRWIDSKVIAAKRSRKRIYEDVVLTPALAAALLERNEWNRPISKMKLSEYKRDIKGGRWPLNGETIKVSDDGFLNDGQHRCVAVRDTGQSVEMTICFGVSRDSRFTVDCGNPRTVGHYLGMNGVVNCNGVAAIASHIWQYRKLGRISGSSLEKGTKAEILLVANEHPDILASLNACKKKGAVICAPSVLAFCHWIIGRRSEPAMVSDFFHKLIDGHKLDTGDPILSARNRLIGSRGHKNPNEKAEIIFRAWNLHRNGHDRVRGIPLSGGKLPRLEI